MSFRIKPGETVGRGVRRIARSQIASAQVTLEELGGSDLETAVHTVRKQLKRVRALIRLARNGLGRDLAERQNALFRDIGRPLSELRDADVLIRTLDQLVAKTGDGGQPEAIAQACQALRVHRSEVGRHVLDEADTLAHVAQVLAHARAGVKRWDVEHNGWDVLAGGLKRIYAQGFRAFHQAVETPTDEPLHEWRKRVKDLAYAMEILKPVRPSFTESHRRLAATLADALGDDHDLVVLGETLSNFHEPLQPLIAARRAELRSEAFALGEQLFVERPKDFAARFQAYWRAWRSEFHALQFERDLQACGSHPR